MDVLNAPGSTRKEFQALFNSRNLGTVQELSMNCWEETKQKKRVKELHKFLIDPQGYLGPLALPLPGEIPP